MTEKGRTSNNNSKIGSGFYHGIQNPSFIDNNKSYFEVDFKHDKESKNSTPTEQTEQSISKIINEAQITKISGISNNNNTGSNDVTYNEYSKIFGPNRSQDTSSFNDRYYKIKEEKEISQKKIKNNKNNLVLGNLGKVNGVNRLIINNMKSMKSNEERNRNSLKSNSIKHISSSEKELTINQTSLKTKGKAFLLYIL